MKFHHLHGSAVTISTDKTTATRSHKHFCNGITFGDQTLNIGLKVVVELNCVSTWSGALRIGLTSHEPCQMSQHMLPRYACPDLVNKDGYWIRAVNEKYAADGNRLSFYVNVLGQLQLFVNSEHKGVFLNNIPTSIPLWLLLDLYGNTLAAKFIHLDNTPKEISAHGPEAVQTYEKACSLGFHSLYWTRLMLVGKDRVGKTSLKKALLGQKHNTAEEGTDGVDLSASCSFNTNDKLAWKQAIDSQPEYKEQDSTLDIIGGSKKLEEEYYEAIAANIYHELIVQKQDKDFKWKNSVKEKFTKKEKDKSHGTVVLGNKVSPGTISQIPSSMLSEVPDHVVELVQHMLEQRLENKQDLKTENKPTPSSHQVFLNIWDFAGQAAYYTTHQVFLSSRAVYIIVFNLCQELVCSKEEHGNTDQTLEEEFSSLSYIDYWMRSIHAHAAENTKNSISNTTLSPPIFLVGTHRNSLDPDPEMRKTLVEEKFYQLNEFLLGKPYSQHVVKPFFAVENNLIDSGEDEQIRSLRETVEKVASQEPYMGEQIPIRWLKFEQTVQEFAENGTNFICMDQIKELTADMQIINDNELKTMLEFYHDLGRVIYYGGEPNMLDNVLRNIAILNPQWLVDVFKRVITAKNPVTLWRTDHLEKWQRLKQFGILEEALINVLWEDVIGQKTVLLGLMEKFDLICVRTPPELEDSRTKSYFVPARLQQCKDKNKLYITSEADVVFYLDFNGFLPDGLFHRIVTRAIRWSQDNGGNEPYLYYRISRLFLDTEHDLVLEMLPAKYSRLKVIVTRVTESREIIDDETGGKAVQKVNPHATAKVRNFLDSTLSDLREMWIKRISYKTCLSCPCGRICTKHGITGCLEESCLHFLNLDECLTNRVVSCHNRQVKTSFMRKWFPSPASTGPILPVVSLEETRGNIEKEIPDLPLWIKSAAKLLNSGTENQDWVALAKTLGYKKCKLDKLNDDLNPALALLADWVLGSGNSQVSIDMLMSYLDQLNRHDIVDIIHKERERVQVPASVFISYQWDAQEDVQALWNKLERSGFSCWMDIGQMGGGDQLYTKIEEGIRNCKVVISCITPKYVVSQHCNRELMLADLLCKPIVPVMFENVLWPPPGGMALVFSSLVYINMKGIGGHGGTGIHADLEDKYSEIIQRISHYSLPDQSRQLDSVSDHSALEKTADNFSTSLNDTISSSTDYNQQQPDENIVTQNVPQHLPSWSNHENLQQRRRRQWSRCGFCILF